MRKKALSLLRLFLWTGIVIFTAAPFFIKTTFGSVTFEQILFHLLLLKNPFQFIGEFWAPIAFFICCMTLLLIVLFRLNVVVKYLIILFAGSFLFAIYQTGGLLYFYTLWGGESTFFEDHYKVPAENEIKMPRQKKNVVWIIMESMEKTFGSYQQTNLIPHLTQIERENVSFYGFEQIYGTGWTIAGLASMMSGVPIKSFHVTDGKTFLPGAVSFVSLLADHGYQTIYINGSDLDFMQKKVYLKSHGFTRLMGSQEFKQAAKTNPIYGAREYETCFGYRDADLYRIVKNELQTAATGDKPFFMTVLTVGTHHPYGYPDSSCSIHYRDIRDSIVCADNEVFDFLNWMKSQPFYKDTLIVITGDHLQMESSMSDELDKAPREIVTTFINSSLPAGEIHRPYTHFDIAPTLMEMMGIELPTHQFGLGVSLISDTPTLLEQMGREKINEQIQKPSKLYNSFLK